MTANSFGLSPAALVNWVRTTAGSLAQDFFFSPEITGAARASLFQSNHVTPNEIVELPEFANFYARISDSSVSAANRWESDNFAKNGQYQPRESRDAFVLGTSNHNGSHPRYTEYVKNLDR